MDRITCEVFPSPDRDYFAELDGEERMQALLRAFGRITDFMQSEEGLSAVLYKYARMTKDHPPTVAYLKVNPALAEKRTGFPGVTEILAICACNGRALEVPFLEDMHSYPSHPILAIGFGVTALWPPGSENFPFFESLSRLIGENVRLILGYSCPYDPYTADR